MRDQENLRERRKQNHLKHKKKRNALCRIYGKQYRLNNKEKIKQKSQQYYLDNKEKILQQTKLYVQNNNDKVRAYHRQYSKKDIYQQRKKQYRLDHWDRILELQRQRIKKPQWILSSKINNAKRRAKKKFTQDWTVTKQFIEWLFIVQDYKCNLCWCDITIKYHIDHIYPLSKWWLHIANNIQLLCKRCNLCKWSKILS